jgi:hypothetical protein
MFVSILVSYSVGGLKSIGKRLMILSSYRLNKVGLVVMDEPRINPIHHRILILGAISTVELTVTEEL